MLEDSYLSATQCLFKSNAHNISCLQNKLDDNNIFDCREVLHTKSAVKYLHHLQLLPIPDLCSHLTALQYT